MALATGVAEAVAAAAACAIMVEEDPVGVGLPREMLASNAAALVVENTRMLFF
jgi:hypothetical protein